MKMNKSIFYYHINNACIFLYKCASQACQSENNKEIKKKRRISSMKMYQRACEQVRKIDREIEIRRQIDRLIA